MPQPPVHLISDMISWIKGKLEIASLYLPTGYFRKGDPLVSHSKVVTSVDYRTIIMEKKKHIDKYISK